MNYHTHLNVFESQIMKDLRCERLDIDVKSTYRNLVYFQCLDLEVNSCVRLILQKPKPVSSLSVTRGILLTLKYESLDKQRCVTLWSPAQHFTPP